MQQGNNAVCGVDLVDIGGNVLYEDWANLPCERREVDPATFGRLPEFQPDVWSTTSGRSQETGIVSPLSINHLEDATDQKSKPEHDFIIFAKPADGFIVTMAHLSGKASQAA